MSVYRYIRPLIFRVDPETAHRLALGASAALGKIGVLQEAAERRWGTQRDPRLETTVAGIVFPNPIGLGAGYDKSGEAIPLLSRMGFGFLEIGSVSRFPSVGNAVRPRAFRLPADEALIINYGVPNDGADIVASRIRSVDSAVPFGVNLVETNTGRDTDPDHVIEELTQAAAMFAPLASFLAISAECANVPGMHPMAKLENLRKLLDAVGRTGPLPPVFVKLRVPAEMIDDVLRITDGYPFVCGFRINTIQPRPYVGLNTPPAVWEQFKGSLTSPLLGYPAMLQAVRDWYRRTDPLRYALIASGGIRSGQDAYATLRAGASLVQCVTALIFQGPSLARRINEELLALMELDGANSVADIVGVEHGKVHR